MAKKPADIWGVPIPSPKDVVNYLNNAVNQGRVASGDKAAVLPGDQGVRNLGRGISMTNDYLNPYANTTKQLLGMAAGNPGAEAKFAKSLARDVAITGAAVGLGKAAGPAIKAAQNTGLPARLKNTIKGETILVHGSPVKGLPTIEARTGSNRLPDDKVVFGWDPEHFLPKDKFGLASQSMQRSIDQKTYEMGSVYIVRGKKKLDVLKDVPGEKFMKAIADDLPVEKEFKIPQYMEKNQNSTHLAQSALQRDLASSLKKLGVKTELNVFEKIREAQKASTLARKQARDAKNKPWV